MIEAFDELFDRQMPTPPARLFTDQGKEFEAGEMRKYFREERMIAKHCSTDKSVKAGVAERMIRIIKHRLYRYFSEMNTENWVDAVGDIVHAINHSVCRVTGLRPVDITRGNADAVWQRLYGTAVEDSRRGGGKKFFKKDDAVRLALDKPVFRKGTLPTFTDEIFRVDQAVDQQDPMHYYLRDHKGERIKGRVYGPEMTRTREDEETTYRIERVLRRAKGKALVKYIGYPDTYWIDESQFV
jgi:hypothetical protein